MRQSPWLKSWLLVLALITQLIAGSTGAIALCFESDGCIRIESSAADCCRPSSAAAHDDAEPGEESGCGSCLDIVLDAGPRRADDGASTALAPLTLLTSTVPPAEGVTRVVVLGPVRHHAPDLASSALCARLRC